MRTSRSSSLSLVLLPLVFGCGYSTHYPVWGGGYVDTGPGSGTADPEIPCGEDGPVGELQVINTMYNWIELYEVQPSTCEQVRIGYVNPGEPYASSVVTGHTWVARGVDGSVVEVFVVPFGTVDPWVEYVP